MKALTVKALDAMIDQIIKDNEKAIKENILKTADDTMTKEEIFSLMVVNCLSLSMKLSVQVVFELLQSQGILDIDEHKIAKLYLKHLSFEKEE